VADVAFRSLYGRILPRGNSEEITMRKTFALGLFISLSFCLARPTFADELGGAENEIIDLYKSGKLFDKAQYKAVRSAFARLFEEKHEALIRKAYGEDHEKLTAWLKARPDVKEDFYTALDERHDKLGPALVLFKTIWKEFPEQVEPYANVAIAVAVTWDDDRRGVYDYTGHQLRTKSTMPEKLTDALANFRYLTEDEKVFEGRVRHLPWEFLIFVVDHRTPIEERKWAQGYYQAARLHVKSMHQDVPYDHDMLKGELTKDSKLKPKLDGLEYTLKNIKERGGVCAQQADFAARVGKSVAVPSVFCWGESSYRGLHAWCLYVNIKQANKEKITFTLASDGRFVGFVKDAFYTGHVIDPKSGEQILDRDMERRLWVAGNDRAGKRQADLIMRAYPWLCKHLDLDVKARVAYLDQCLKVSAHNEPAWLTFAKLAKEGELDATQKQVVLSHLSSMNKTFADYPDFVWKVFDDLLTVQSDAKERAKLYETVVALFEHHGRPDLACDARLKIAQLWCEQEKWDKAAQGLTYTIHKFPSEGRYIPKLTLKLQEVAKHTKGGNDALAKLYIELVPAMILHYKEDAAGEYCTKMYDQGMQFMKENNLERYAAELKAQAERARLLAQKK
jgi:hypothetical protein